MLTVTPLPEYLVSGRCPEELRPERVPSLIVEWDRADEVFWLIRLCEDYGAAGTRWEYPPPAHWSADPAGRLRYSDHPPADDASIAGRSAVSAEVKDDELTFEVSLRNDSTAAWPDAWGWVCLIHRWANAFQANCELPVGQEGETWRPCACLRAPMGRWLKWCPVAERLEEATRIGTARPDMWQGHLQAKRPAVRAWRMALGRPVRQFVELSSPDAILLGWSHWPCTDMGLYFGTLGPGQTGTVRGRLRFFEEPYTPV